MLRPGDALYLPRGWLHSAEALGDVSVHLTVGIHSVTRYALVEALVALAAEEPELRASLPLGVDVADPDAISAPTWPRPSRRWPAGSARPTRARSPTGCAVACGHRPGRSRSARWPRPRRPARSPTTTAVRVRGGLRHRLRPADGGSVVLELPDRTLTAAGRHRGAVRALLSGQVLPAGQLPGLDPADGRTLVARLLRESIVVPAGA